MKPPSTVAEAAGSAPTRTYGLPVTEGTGIPHPDAEGITEEVIHDVVVEFYRRARRDERLGPVFEAHIHEWETHLARMIDFWSAALLRDGGMPAGRSSGTERSTASVLIISADGSNCSKSTVRDLCPAGQANAFMVRARLMRQGMSRVLGLDSCLAPDGAGSTESSPGL